MAPAAAPAGAERQQANFAWRNKDFEVFFIFPNYEFSAQTGAKLLTKHRPGGILALESKECQQSWTPSANIFKRGY